MILKERCDNRICLTTAEESAIEYNVSQNRKLIHFNMADFPPIYPLHTDDAAINDEWRGCMLAHLSGMNSYESIFIEEFFNCVKHRRNFVGVALGDELSSYIAAEDQIIIHDDSFIFTSTITIREEMLKFLAVIRNRRWNGKSLMVMLVMFCNGANKESSVGP